MDKNIPILRFFTFSYWSRRSYLVEKWNSRKNGIKHQSLDKKLISHSVIPKEMKKFNELFQEYKNAYIEINKIHENQRIINSFENLH